MTARTASAGTKRAPGFVAAVLAGHSTLGLTFAALIYVVCLSGTVAVFANELLRWERPDGPVVTSTTMNVVAQAVQAGYARGREIGAVGELVVQMPTADMPRLLIQAALETGALEQWVADEQGALTEGAGIPWWEFLIGLHVRLHLPGLWGLIVVGIVGVFTGSLIASGILAHPRILKDAFLLRWGGSRRLQEADLHNRLSVWGLPFHLTIALSGAVLALAPIMVNLLVETAYEGDTSKIYLDLYGPGPDEDRTEAPIPDIQAIVADLLKRYPDAAVETIVLQNVATAGQLVHVTTKRPGQLNLTERHFFDSDGRFLRTAGYDDGPAGIQWTAAMTPLHYGWFGGWFVKLAYGALGAALTTIAATGVNIWLARWSDKGRIRRSWQRVWTAVVWGQPMALSASALVALAGYGASVVTAYFAVVIAAFAVACLVADNRLLSRALRFAGAASLLALAAGHSIVWSGQMADSMGWAINAALAGLAAVMVVTAIDRRPTDGRLPQ